MGSYWIYLVIYAYIGYNMITTTWYEHERVRWILMKWITSTESYDEDYYKKIDSTLYFKLRTSSELIAWTCIVLCCIAYPITMPITRYKVYKAEELLQNRPR